MIKNFGFRLASQSLKKLIHPLKYTCNQTNQLYFLCPSSNVSRKSYCNTNTHERKKISLLELKDIIENNFTQKSYNEFEKKLSQICDQEDLDISHFNSFKGQYKFLFEAIEKIDLQNFLEKRIDFNSSNQEQLTISLIKLITINSYFKKDQVFDLPESASQRVFFLATLLILKASTSLTSKLIQFCETQLHTYLKEGIKEKVLEKENIVKPLFLLYCENRGLFSQETLKLIEEYFVFQLKENEAFSTDYSFLLETVKRVEENPIFIDLNNAHLLQHETPFQITVKQENPLLDGTEIIEMESSTNIIYTIQSIVINKLKGDSEINSLSSFSACLKILTTSNYRINQIIDHIIKTLEQILESDCPKSPGILIDVCMQIIFVIQDSLPFHRELLKKSLKRIYEVLYQGPLNLQQSFQIYSIFRHTQTVDQRLLHKLEEIILPKITNLEIGSFLNFFFFYSSMPRIDHEFEIPQKDLNIYVKFHFKRFSFENLLDIVNASLQLDFKEKVESVAYLPVLDSQMWSQIFGVLLQTKPEKLSLKEKVKFFRILKILSFVIEGDVFNYPLIQKKIAALSKTFLALSDLIESNFQKEIERYLLDLSKVYQKEKMIEDLFFVDFLVGKKQVIEVNGPSHYFIVFEDNKETYKENKSTEFKRKMIQMLGYEYYAIHFFEWFDLPSESKKKEHLRRKLMKILRPY